MKLTTLILAATIPIAAPSLAQAPQPYAMRGLALGITLEQFKLFPIPSDNGDLAEIACTDVPHPRMHMKDEPHGDNVMGIITCQWFSLMSGAPTAGWFNHGVLLGDASGFPSFSFVPVEGRYRLFRIIVTGDNDRFPQHADLLDALTVAYGTPQTSTSMVQNKLGAQFSSSTSIWRNGVSSIVLEERGARITDYRLTYRHDALGQIYDAMLRQRAASAAGRL